MEGSNIMPDEEIESCRCCLHSEQECHDLIRYAQMGYIGRIRRRLNEKEKNKIKPGSIFIYKEQESGIKRWTDKKEWTPSRVHGIFLIYRDLNGPLLKKTYSIELKDGKYHIVAYTLLDWEGDGQCCLLFNKAPVTGFRRYLPTLWLNSNEMRAEGWPAEYEKREEMGQMGHVEQRAMGHTPDEFGYSARRPLPYHARVERTIPQSPAYGNLYYRPGPPVSSPMWQWQKEQLYHQDEPFGTGNKFGDPFDSSSNECSLYLNQILSRTKSEEKDEQEDGNDVA